MDEGAVVAYPSRVLDGAVPHRDFLTFYGPGNLWIVAGAFEVFGESVGTERAVGLLYRLVIVLSLFLLGIRRLGGRCGPSSPASSVPCVMGRRAHLGVCDVRRSCVRPAGDRAHRWSCDGDRGRATDRRARGRRTRGWRGDPRPLRLRACCPARGDSVADARAGPPQVVVRRPDFSEQWRCTSSTSPSSARSGSPASRAICVASGPGRAFPVPQSVGVSGTFCALSDVALLLFVASARCSGGDGAIEPVPQCSYRSRCSTLAHPSATSSRDRTQSHIRPFAVVPLSLLPALVSGRRRPRQQSPATAAEESLQRLPS